MHRPTPQQITIRRLDHLLGLSDRELCVEDHRTGPAPGDWPCGRNEINPDGDVKSCCALGEWARKPRGRRGRRGCTRHIAAEIRAEHWLYRRQIAED